MKIFWVALVFFLAVKGEARQLAVGEQAVVPVQSAHYWNATSLHFQRGEQYRFVARGIWIDLYIVTSAAGFTSQTYPQLFLLVPFEPYRRMPHSNWFALIGGIARQEDTAFEIGVGGDFEITEDGEFTPYANDVPWKYGNNSGAVWLQVLRLR